MVAGLSTAGLDGCSGGIGANLEVSDIESDTTPLGNLVIYVLVSNKGIRRGDGRLVTQVDIEGADTCRKSKPISVSAGDSNTYEFGFDIPLSDSLSGYQYWVDAWID